MEGFISKILRKFRHMKFLSKCRHIVKKINALEASIHPLTDDELKAKTAEFKQRFQNGESLNDLLPEAFAVVREASLRVFGKRHFDVQLIGGIIIHYGNIVEMKTGEGKTLCATAPAYLNTLCGKQVHIITVNDYLAKVGAEEMGKLYSFLGVTVGAIHQHVFMKERVYQSDIIYATNSEIAFDYLRDNMKKSPDFLIKEFYFAIVDEVDSILIDEARTPLIISGESHEASKLCIQADEIIKTLTESDYIKDEKHKHIMFTEAGIEKIEKLLIERNLVVDNLYSQYSELVHCLNQALKANIMMHKDVDYMIQNNKVVIIDESTGRIMDGRRYSDGLHQALEVKENVIIQPENRTIASTTYQNFFRMYTKLSGMTGTADTESEEFMEIYNLEVFVVPTHLPVQRKDEVDRIYGSLAAKTKAIVEMVREKHKHGQPILIGTSSVEKSEYFSHALSQAGITHNTLNARNHANEAQIISQAGRSYAVTIATNMAGRGTDIKLGGENHDPIDKEKVLLAGGLLVIGTERHENRRIDNQLIGRSGRQGDPGMSIFFISLEDDLLRIFGNPRIAISDDPDRVITSKILSKLLASAQEKVERMHFESRKNVLKYDDILNIQRQIIYGDRRDILHTEFHLEKIRELATDLVDRLLDKYMGHYVHEWNLEKLFSSIKEIFNISLEYNPSYNFNETREQILSSIYDMLVYSESILRHDNDFDKIFIDKVLSYIDNLWTQHINMLDRIREGIHLQSYGQKDPFHSYQDTVYSMFIDLRDDEHKYLIHYYITHAQEYKMHKEYIYNTINKNIQSVLNYFIISFVNAIVQEKIYDVVKAIIEDKSIHEYMTHRIPNYIIECIKKFIKFIKDIPLLINYFLFARKIDNVFANLINKYRINTNISLDISNIILEYMMKDIERIKKYFEPLQLNKIPVLKLNKDKHKICYDLVSIQLIETANQRNQKCHTCASGKRYKSCHGHIKYNGYSNIIVLNT